MERDACGLVEFPRPGFDIKAIINVINQLPRSVSQRSNGGIRVFFELKQVAVTIHRRAGSGRHDHGQFAGENLRRMLGHLTRRAPLARIECRLAAARLIFRIVHGYSEVLQNLDRGAGHIIVKRIAKAGAHQEHAFAKRAGSRNGHGNG